MYNPCIKLYQTVTQRNIRDLEMVQRRAARFVIGDYRTTSSVTQMLEQLQWSTLQERRKRAKVIMLYRVVHQLVEVPSTYLVPTTTAFTTRGHQIRYQLPYSRLQSHQQSFFPSAIRLWNNLPASAVGATSIEGFKDSLTNIVP